MTTETQTVGQWLEELAASNQSDDRDAIKMTNLLHRVGFSQAVCTCGIVYMEGKGTIESPPMSINSVAKILVGRANRTA